MTTYKLHEIWTYPVKSLQGVALNTANVEDRGLQHDRRWMLTDDKGMFITQRKYPQLAMVRLKWNKNQIVLQHTKQRQVFFSTNQTSSKKIEVQVWKATCEAVEVSEEINQWFSELLQKDCKLVYMPATTRRIVDPDYAPQNTITGFADGFPFLLISQASLDDLNSRMEIPIPMDRFRPNLVVSGTKPYEEDTWKMIRIGNIVFQVAKPCARCVFTTIDQETGIQGKEPLKTLSTYRKADNKILFGQNLVQLQTGKIQEGDRVEIIE